MAEDRPTNGSGAGGPDRSREGQARRGGRHRGHRGNREVGPQSASDGRQAEAPKDIAGDSSRDGGRESQRPASRDDQARQGRRPDEAIRSDAARDMPSCPLCGKPVYDLSTAVAASREQPEPAHFDCVIERVTASETLAAGEKLVYLGSGSFGVVVFKDKNESAFTIVRRIQWEKEGEKRDWRKGLSSRIQNL